MWASAVEGVAVYVFPAAMAYAAIRDVATYEVPNWVSVGIALAFVGLALGAGMATIQLASHVAAGLAVLVAGWVLFAVGVFGGADAKILAAGAVWVGWPGLTEYIFAVALAGGALALMLAVWRKVGLPRGWQGRAWIERLHRRDGSLPYCVAIAAAGIWMFPSLAPMAG